ncbi:hypothetical protein FOZ63_008201 [Perkinsus olseni]|uniref:Uncharacterized protein n=1 Tax=Perkinsus olseni TaxID=32597 RepID=A0A7J6PWS6_PEROL|nr:hypothetical protein FOZ63_008201 [Perkinsus olseni]
MSTQSAAAARLARKLEKFNQHERDLERRARQLSMLEEQEAEHKRLVNRDASLGYERRKKERAIEWEAAHQRRWEDSLRDRHQQEQQDSRFKKVSEGQIGIALVLENAGCLEESVGGGKVTVSDTIRRERERYWASFCILEFSVLCNENDFMCSLERQQLEKQS